MFRQTGISTREADPEERSMRVVEWVMALAAALAAGVLTFIR
jgi:hypothetical protein